MSFQACDAACQKSKRLAQLETAMKTGATPENFVSEWRGLKFENRDKLQKAIDKAKIGKNCKIGSNVIIENALLGDNIIIKSGTLIGQTGFGFSFEKFQFANSFNLGAYGSEVVRASVQSVGREQREAAKALNYTNFQLYRYVLIPQAIPVMIPSFGNLVIELLKLTAVASLITISDLTFMSQIIRVQTALTLEPLILIMVIYFILSSILVSGTKWLERYFSAGRNIHKNGGN